MILNAMLAAAAILAPAQPLSCPVAHHAAGADGPVVYVAGAKFTLCCPDCFVCCGEMGTACCDNCGDSCLKGEKCCDSCAPAMKGVAAENVAAAAEKGLTVGEFLFDPVAKTRIQPKDAKATVDFKGMRYYFASEANKAKFDADPLSYAQVPEKEALYCSVMKHAIASYDKAGGYVDHEGVRYYVCCPNCLGAMAKDPAKFAPNGKDTVKAVVTFWKQAE